MDALTASRARTAERKGDLALAARLARETEGEVLFDAFSRGRYATDASAYQIEPLGVLVPKSVEDVRGAIEIAGDEGLPLLPRGGGTSQCGQTVGEALVIDTSKYLNRVLDFDPASQSVRVEPGIVLDDLNGFLRPHGLWFPVDVSTASRATIGGMAGNNSCGARSLRYGTMRDSVSAIEALLPDGGAMRFAALAAGGDRDAMGERGGELVRALEALGRREAAEIAARFPKLMRRVGGYNVDALAGNAPANLAHLLVGSEGTLAFSTAIELRLAPIPTNKTLGVCHFPSLHDAMAATKAIVGLGPDAVELADRTMIDLAREIPLFQKTIEAFIQGRPGAVLLVEFTAEEPDTLPGKLSALDDLLGDLGFPGALVKATTPSDQRAIWDLRRAGLNIVMSMKGDGKPVSFVEDCAVALEDLADYTDRLSAVFQRHGTEGTWYAHASVGCLHVRPILNLKQEDGAKRMRAIAEEAFALVRGYKGSHSGEHGDGLVRSEFHEAMFGSRLVRAFEEVKDLFDPAGLMNPGKIVRPPKMDDRTLFRYPPGYRTDGPAGGFDWSDWGGFGGAVEMCNNNGACRKRDAAVMCPSFRATGDEKHVTRGRANVLRLALSGQLGPDALASDEMAEAMSLCIGCKACKRECPTGVDMTRMKTEVLYHRGRQRGWSWRDRVIGHLPRYAPWMAALAPLANLRDGLPGLAGLSEKLLGFTTRRPLPAWRRDRLRDNEVFASPQDGPEVVLWGDCFNRYFEPEVARSAAAVLGRAGYQVRLARPADGGRPLCCGRSYLSVGMVEDARREAARTLEALAPFLSAGLPVIGLEPSCLLTFRDEYQALLPGAESEGLAAKALLFEEFLAGEQTNGSLKLPLSPIDGTGRALLHGHCHQKAFGAMGAVQQVLELVPELKVEALSSGCCGMAGAFGYGAETYDVSMKMAELALLPRLREAPERDLVVADGTSCRHQIAHGMGRTALHVAQVLDRASAVIKSH